MHTTVPRMTTTYRRTVTDLDGFLVASISATTRQATARQTVEDSPSDAASTPRDQPDPDLAKHVLFLGP